MWNRINDTKIKNIYYRRWLFHGKKMCVCVPHYQKLKYIILPSFVFFFLSFLFSFTPSTPRMGIESRTFSLTHIPSMFYLLSYQVAQVDLNFQSFCSTLQSVGSVVVSHYAHFLMTAITKNIWKLLQYREYYGILILVQKAF